MSHLNTPIAVIIAGITIAGAILITGSRGDTTPASVDSAVEISPETISLDPITKKDHILGDFDASVIIVEYSDTECPFCKRYHETLNQIVEEYSNGSVAWVYRHFPIDSLHSKARKEAEATECAAEIGGNEGFWNYINRLFEITPSNNGLDLAILPEIAVEIGLDREVFIECLESGKKASIVADQLQSGIDAGVRGTPGSFIITRDGTVIQIPGGAQPFEVIKSAIDQILN